MPEKYFFEIPVFRCTKAQWNLERPIEVKKLARSLFNDKDLTKKNIDSASFFVPEKSSYYYGALVGMIKLYTTNQIIKAELFFIKERVTKSLKNKTWLSMGKIFEFMVLEHTNEEIFNLIFLKIKERDKDEFFVHRFIDLESFTNIGRFLDYRTLVSF